MTTIVRPVWTDVSGFQLQTSFNTNGSPDAPLFIGNLQLYSSAQIGVTRSTTVTLYAGGPSEAGAFASVGDVADLVFLDGLYGAPTHLLIPAPIDGTFLVDGETVDPVFMDSVISSAISILTNRAGISLASYAYGYRKKLFQRVSLR